MTKTTLVPQSSDTAMEGIVHGSTMALKPKELNRLGDFLLLALAVAVFFAVYAFQASAGSDNTFSASLTTLTDWTEGSLGKILGVSSVAVAMIGAVAKFDWRLCAGAAAVGLMAATGPTIVSSMATAIF